MADTKTSPVKKGADLSTKNPDEMHYTVIGKTGKAKVVNVLDVLEPKDIWQVGKSKIISLVGVQKIADLEGIVEKNIRTEVTPTEGNKQQHVVNIWVGYKGDDSPDDWKRGSGEASILNTGKVVNDTNGGRKYEEFNQVDSKYRYSMADKRAYCRAVIKLIRLHGVYADVEAADFARQSGSDIDNHDY